MATRLDESERDLVFARTDATSESTFPVTFSISVAQDRGTELGKVEAFFSG